MAVINSVADLSIEGEVAVVTINSPPVNALSQPVRDGLKRGVEAQEANGAVKAIVIICEGRTFIAGADISEFGKPPAPPHLPVALDTIENAPSPSRPPNTACLRSSLALSRSPGAPSACRDSLAPRRRSTPSCRARRSAPARLGNGAWSTNSPRGSRGRPHFVSPGASSLD
jgi:hypothetical protein